MPTLWLLLALPQIMVPLATVVGRPRLLLAKSGDPPLTLLNEYTAIVPPEKPEGPMITGPENVLLPLKSLRATDVSLWLRLGQLHARLEEFEQAEQALRQVTSLAPQRALGYAALAQLYLPWKGRAAEASTAAGEAVRREPTAANFALLSAVRDRCGDTRGALEAIEKALQLEPGNGDYQQRYLALRRKS